METNNTKVEKMSTTKTTSRKRTPKAAATTSPVHEGMVKLESAYEAAITGKMKFGEVKSIFKQLHKEIKKSVKSKN